MWFRREKTAPQLTQELVERTWDISGRLKLLESTLDERLEELSKRYRRAEQSEKRLDEKIASGPCADGDPPRRQHPYIAARRARRERLNNRLKEHVE